MRRQPEPTPESQACGCSGEPRPSLEHNLTCSKMAIFLLSYPAGILGYGSMEEHFRFYGYKPSVTVPTLESVKEFGDKMAEMMQCDCEHWFPRWAYYRCPKCQKEH